MRTSLGEGPHRDRLKLMRKSNGAVAGGMEDMILGDIEPVVKTLASSLCYSLDGLTK